MAKALQTWGFRVIYRKAAASTGSARTRHETVATASAQTAVISRQRPLAVGAEARYERAPRGGQNAPHRHGTYGTRGRIEWRPALRYTPTVQVAHLEFGLQTRGHGHVLDISADVESWIASIVAVDGQLTVFVPGSTAAVTTIEFEPGAVRDLDQALEELAPSDRDYHHDQRWGDGNGFSHLRAALMGPSLTVPVAAGRCILGTWQQIVVVECDLRPRARRVVLSFVGSCEDDA